MISIFFVAITLALVWVGLIGKVTLDSLLVGYLIGVLVLFLLRAMGITFETSASARRPIALVEYMLRLLWIAVTSSFKMAKLVLSPKIELHTGIIALNTGDLSEAQTLSALSAHAINLTPGELTIDIEDGGVLYIHCINIDASRANVEKEQAQRLRLLKHIVGDKS